MNTKTFLDYANQVLQDITTRVNRLARTQKMNVKQEHMTKGILVFSAVTMAVIARELQRLTHAQSVGPIGAMMLGATVGVIGAKTMMIWPIVTKRENLKLQSTQIEDRIASSLKEDKHAFLAFGLLAHTINQLGDMKDNLESAIAVWQKRVELFTFVEESLASLDSLEDKARYLMRDHNEILTSLGAAPEVCDADSMAVEASEHASSSEDDILDGMDEIEMTPVQNKLKMS